MKERPANTERSTIPSRRRGRLLKRSAMAVTGRKTGSGCWGGFIISSTARRAPDPIGAAAWRAHPHAHLCVPIWPVTGQPHPRNGKEEGTTGVLPTVAGDGTYHPRYAAPGTMGPCRSARNLRANGKWAYGSRDEPTPNCSFRLPGAGAGHSWGSYGLLQGHQRSTTV